MTYQPIDRFVADREAVLGHPALWGLVQPAVEVPFISVIVPVKDETGWVTHWVSVERDTTDSRAAEQQLKRSQQDLAATLGKLELASHMAKIGGWELDVSTMQPYWSPETCRIHEVDPPVTPPLDQAIAFYAPEAVPMIMPVVVLLPLVHTPYGV